MTDRSTNEAPGAAEHAMRRVLHELQRLRSVTTSDAEALRKLRESVRAKLAEVEQQARKEADGFAPEDIGEEARLTLRPWFQQLPARRAPAPPPASLADARREWAQLEDARQDVTTVKYHMEQWTRKVLRRRSSMPTITTELWNKIERLSEVHSALPALRERHVAAALDAHSQLEQHVTAEANRRAAEMDAAYERLKEMVEELDSSVPVTGGSWGHPGWSDATVATRPQRLIRLGQLDPQLPQSADVPPVPALLRYPFQSGLAIGADTANRAAAVDLARSTVLRILAAEPPGDVRFVFVDPVSLGQSVADFRHLSEFDQRLVDVKTWTSERDIERRLEELSDHLEVVISSYLRGQFDSIDEYNEQAGEVAEPYRVLVVFDYPTGFSDRAARQLLSLIENGPRCGVHTILVHDPAAKSPDGVPLQRLTHSMQRIDLTKGRLTFPQPIGALDLDFLPDACPPISFSPDGRATSPFGQLLLNVGSGARSTDTGPVTLDRVLSIANRQISAGRAGEVPDVLPGAPALALDDPTTWWAATTAPSAHALIGRAGAQDIAGLYLSSTEVAGGAIMVGLPRSGKSTALHAAIISLATRYSPDELELYLIDSKHGVEFKVYERLPHARLVSIHSEREFSVSVLGSIASEIQRRAELMKERSAGRANLTEYRAVTGEKMPRIVLFMDEFHELFEEDDALGHRAFQAFSDIVRQGPFAGVHVIVSSQTLSSMPAMDRSTLTLLPIRVAFMCNDGDADLVMGDQNREVKALSQQGEGILNPVRGETSHNKPFRGLYIAPDERSAILAQIDHKAVASGFVRLPRVFDGDRLADRPRDLPQMTPTRPVFAFGEPFDLEPWAGVTLRRGRGANLLLLGGSDDEVGDPSITGAIHSLLACAAGASIDAYVVDFVGDGEESGGTLDLLTLCQRMSIKYRRASGLDDGVLSLAAEVARRRAASEYTSPTWLLVLYGIQRAYELEPPDPYAPPAEDGEATPVAEALAALLRDGPEVGCHVVLCVDQLAQLDRRLGRDALKEVEWRIAGGDATQADVAAITEAFGEAAVPRSQLLLADHARGRRRRVRAYPPFTATTAPTPTERSHP